MKLYGTNKNPFAFNPPLILAKNKKQAEEFIKKEIGLDIAVYEVKDIEIPCKLFQFNNF